ncbi:MAG: ABC transporter permease subunit [Candidatus Thorarchaeota archaeon]|nr:ABC transporter permease subunit [Candidatus Thorarchaeota archaeon]
MKYSIIVVIARTELKMALKSKMVKAGFLVVAILGPLITLISLGIPLAFLRPGPDIQLLVDFMMPTLPAMLGVFSLVPATLIAANAIVGEREQSTLEPLLCTPLTDKELLLGKMLSSFIPGIIVLFLQIILSFLAVTIPLVLMNKPLFLFPNLPGLFLLVLVTPIMSIAVVSAVIIISGKVSRVYEAYQTAGLVTLIFMVPMVGPLMILESGTENIHQIWFLNVLTLCIAIILTALSSLIALNRFNRDAMVSRI